MENTNKIKIVNNLLYLSAMLCIFLWRFTAIRLEFGDNKAVSFVSLAYFSFLAGRRQSNPNAVIPISTLVNLL